MRRIYNGILKRLNARALTHYKDKGNTFIMRKCARSDSTRKKERERKKNKIK